MFSEVPLRPDTFRFFAILMFELVMLVHVAEDFLIPDVKKFLILALTQID
jgi:hypothetical protein